VSKKNKHAEEHENHERWLVSFADFMTLLFALFTVLYVMANSNAKELEDVMRGMNAAFEGGMPGIVNDAFSPDTSANLSEMATNPMSLEVAPSVIHSIKHGLVGSLSDNVVQIGFINNSLLLTLPEKLLFAPGSAELHPAAFATLTKIAEAVSGTTALLDVIGRADGAPLPAGSKWTDNWELASARALATVRYLRRQGVAEAALSATATLSTEVEPEARAVTIRVRADQPAAAAEVGERLAPEFEEKAAPK